MTSLTPDRWVLVKATKDNETITKVLAGWSGSYLHGDSWRLSSSVDVVTKENGSYRVRGLTSQTHYTLSPDSYGMLAIQAGIFQQLKETTWEISLLGESQAIEFLEGFISDQHQRRH